MISYQAQFHARKLLADARIAAAGQVQLAKMAALDAARRPPSVIEPITAQRIIAATATKHGIGVKDLVSQSMVKHILEARREAIKTVREVFPNESLPWIGRHFNRHHATILNALYGKKCRS